MRGEATTPASRATRLHNHDKAVAFIRAARKLESKFPLWTLKPASELLSNREANEAFLAAGISGTLAAYFPPGGKVRVNHKVADGALVAHWINIDSGEWGYVANIMARETSWLEPPDKGNWAVAIVPGNRVE